MGWRQSMITRDDSIIVNHDLVYDKSNKKYTNEKAFNYLVNHRICKKLVERKIETFMRASFFLFLSTFLISIAGFIAGNDMMKNFLWATVLFVVILFFYPIFKNNLADTVARRFAFDHVETIDGKCWESLTARKSKATARTKLKEIRDLVNNVTRPANPAADPPIIHNIHVVKNNPKLTYDKSVYIAKKTNVILVGQSSVPYTSKLGIPEETSVKKRNAAWVNSVMIDVLLGIKQKKSFKKRVLVTSSSSASFFTVFCILFMLTGNFTGIAIPVIAMSVINTICYVLISYYSYKDKMFMINNSWTDPDLYKTASVKLGRAIEENDSYRRYMPVSLDRAIEMIDKQPGFVEWLRTGVTGV
jgi:hypothetical protein